ncbi:MAG: DNA repair protein RadC [Arenimonas sp.]|nr:DNA repair protein RadC [Arenimonas sp.]
MTTQSLKPWIAAQNKALATGIKSLTLDELLQIISAPHRRRQENVLATLQHSQMKQLHQCAIGEFSQQYQMGIELTCKLAASLEIGTRYWTQPVQRGQLLNNPEQVASWLRTQLRDRTREVFACLFLDNRHRLICYEELFEGSLDCAEVYPRVVLQSALRHQAAALFLVHNHPSGHPEPSASDHALTARLKQALNLVDIRVLDHFIVADNQITSFAERGWL